MLEGKRSQVFIATSTDYYILCVEVAIICLETVLHHCHEFTSSNLFAIILALTQLKCPLYIHVCFKTIFFSLSIGVADKQKGHDFIHLCWLNIEVCIKRVN